MKFIQSVQNPQVKQWKKLLTKKGREKTGQYLLEGLHLVEEALGYKDEIVQLLMVEDFSLPSRWNVDGVEMTVITEEIADVLADTETNQGIFAVCQKRELSNELEGHSFLLIDAVQDPGNIGTMIRTADAAGIDMVVLGSGSADLFNPKVLRSAQGGHFHVKVLQSSLSDVMARLKEKGVPVYGTSLKNAVDYREAGAEDSFAILVGNEGSGVSSHLLEETTRNLYIPIYGKSESLNVAVATGILLYHFQQTLKKV
ncbi:MAG TPA: RNA methyltransferase [Chondromyces sp.]|nr:RNA methyltransferase [Chondromyces sp.]